MLLRGGPKGRGVAMGTPGFRLRELVRVGVAGGGVKGGGAWGGVVPLVGTPNAYSALLAQRAGLPAIYLSGSTLSASSLGLPDLGVATLDEVVEDARRITRVCTLPLLVDIDTGFGGVFSVARAIQELENVGAAGIHIEDQEAQHKRCGHRPNKRLASTAEMVDRIQAAVAARQDHSFVIMARTDSIASEGLDAALKRARAYINAGADMLFPEALSDIETYKAFTVAFPDTPVLANLTEFGRTPLLTLKQLSQAKVSMALFPVSAFRAMARAAEQVYETIAKEGTQNTVLPLMQTRDELYEVLDYQTYEHALDNLYPSKAKPAESKNPSTIVANPAKSDQAVAAIDTNSSQIGTEEEEEQEPEADQRVGELLSVEENGQKVISSKEGDSSTEPKREAKPTAEKETHAEAAGNEEENNQIGDDEDDEDEEEEEEEEEGEERDKTAKGKGKPKIVVSPESAAAKLNAGMEIEIK